MGFRNRGGLLTGIAFCSFTRSASRILGTAIAGWTLERFRVCRADLLAEVLRDLSTDCDFITGCFTGHGRYLMALAVRMAVAIASGAATSCPQALRTRRKVGCLQHGIDIATVKE